MKKKNLALSVAAACCFTGVANAVPVTYDFAGVGGMTVYIGVGGEAYGVHDIAFTGSMTIDVNPEGPGGDDTSSLLDWWIYDNNGWVTSQFVINWDGHTFDPTLTEDASVSHFAEVANRPDYDLMGNGVRYTTGDDHSTGAELVRATTDTTWLSDLSFNDALGMAPAGIWNGFNNNIRFYDSWSTYNAETGIYDSHGMVGGFDLTSLTVQGATSSVPEPGTLTLLSAGLMGAWCSRRRKRSS